MPPLKVHVRVELGPGRAIGPGKIELLERVQRCGSLSQAARDMGMSYRRAWLLLRDLNETVADALTVASTGGRHGGGVRLTAAGQALIRSYRRLERAALRSAEKELGEHAGRGPREAPARRAGR